GRRPRRAGPRFLAAPASSPRSRAARHVVRWDEYSPSRRSNAPTAPGVLQPSAPLTIFRLYSTVNRRRVAFATTSIADPPRACSHALIALQSCLALDTKLPGGHCLTHIGREGRMKSRAHAQISPPGNCGDFRARFNLIARAAHRPEHNDDILTLRPRLMTFRIRAVEQRFARKGEQQHGPRGAGGRPVTRRLYLRVTCSEPLSILFLVHVEGFTLL